MKKRVWTSAPWIIILSLLLISMAVAVYHNNQLVAYIGGGLGVLSLILGIVINVLFKRYITRIVGSALAKVASLDLDYLDRFKLPVVLTGKKGDIVWSNSRFKKQLCMGRNPANENISPFIGAKTVEEIADRERFEIDLDAHHYIVYCNSVDEGFVTFFVDISNYREIFKKYNDTRKSVAIITFDNRDEFSNDSEEESARVLLTLETKLLHFASENNAFFKTLPNDKYMIIFDRAALDKLVADKFPILKEIREIKYNNREATLSVGIGADCDTLVESEQKARKALDMALGRGGDQIAIMKGDSYEFFGGVSSGIEKMSKVRSRVIATSISRVISEADKVLIMGHRFSDLDCVGAAVGLQAIIEKSLKKQCKIIIDRENSMAKSLIELVEREDKAVFLTPEDALRILSARTALIIVDTHIPDRVESPELLQRCKTTVVIDHHRKMVNYIDNSVIFYHEPTASSASEMVAELITYLGENQLEKLQAEALLAGIMLDTKNFVIRTGVRTFEAAAFLRKHGADTVETKQLFSSTLRNHKEKYKIVGNAEVYRGCAISIADGDFENIRLISAQAADELLSVENVAASFVIFETGASVNISARSYGKLNVQLIMEAMGGGGHQNMAAVQLSEFDSNKAKKMLIKAIDKVYPES